MAALVSAREIAQELADFEVELSPRALEQLCRYLDLLLHWNRRINLTGIREPRAIVRRLFGESLYLSRVVQLHGPLLDIGSGAGFPGLALKLVAPELPVTLLEARQKKAAFLREAVQNCGFVSVEVVVERFQEWARRQILRERPHLITTRAVAVDIKLLRLVAKVLDPAGKFVLITSSRAPSRLKGEFRVMIIRRIIEIPGSNGSVCVVFESC